MNREHLTRIGKRHHDVPQDVQIPYIAHSQSIQSVFPSAEQQQSSQIDNNLSFESPDDVDASLREKMRNVLQFYRV